MWGFRLDDFGVDLKSKMEKIFLVTPPHFKCRAMPSFLVRTQGKGDFYRA